LITQLLDKDPSKRLDVEKIKDHPWFQGTSWDDIIQQKKIPDVKPIIKLDLTKNAYPELSQD